MICKQLLRMNESCKIQNCGNTESKQMMLDAANGFDVFQRIILRIKMKKKHSKFIFPQQSDIHLVDLNGHPTWKPQKHHKRCF